MTRAIALVLCAAALAGCESTRPRATTPRDSTRWLIRDQFHGPSAQTRELRRATARDYFVDDHSSLRLLGEQPRDAMERWARLGEPFE